jgi:hypothetical protein
MKIRSQQSEIDRVKRDTIISSEQNRILERTIEDLKHENNQFRDRLTMLESEKINLFNEKERRERECKSM